MYRKILSAGLAVLVGCLFFPAATRAQGTREPTVAYVMPSCPDDLTLCFETIQAAIDAKTDVVYVSPGIYYEHNISVDHDVALIADPQPVVIDAGENGRVFIATDSLERLIIEGVTLYDGKAPLDEWGKRESGGFISAPSANVTLRGVTMKYRPFSEYRTQIAAHQRQEAQTVEPQTPDDDNTDLRFSQGGFLDVGSLTLEDTLIEGGIGNLHTMEVGHIEVADSLTMTNSTIQWGLCAPAVHVYSGTVTMVNSAIQNWTNYCMAWGQLSDGTGAGLVLEKPVMHLTVLDSEFKYNISEKGSAIYSLVSFEGATLMVDNSRFVGNIAKHPFGDDTFVQQSKMGGAIFMHMPTTATIQNSSFEHNAAVHKGGAIVFNYDIYPGGDGLLIKNCMFDGNGLLIVDQQKLHVDGAAIYGRGLIHIEDTTIKNTFGLKAGYALSFIYKNAEAHIKNTKIISNTVGGIGVRADSRVWLTNTVIANSGYAWYTLDLMHARLPQACIVAEGYLTVTNSTLHNCGHIYGDTPEPNWYWPGGSSGIFVAQDTAWVCDNLVTIRNTAITGVDFPYTYQNHNERTGESTIVVDHYNGHPTVMVDNGADGEWLLGVMSYFDPDNHDLAIAEDSDAKDMGNPAYAPFTDIVGKPREGLPDIGAYEAALPCTELTDVSINHTFMPPDIHTFTASPVPGYADDDTLQYTWDNGDTGTASIRILPVGVHTVTVAAENACSVVTATKQITVVPQCFPVTELQVTQTPPFAVYSDTLTFHVNITPAYATPPYTYTIDYQDSTVVGIPSEGTVLLDPTPTFTHKFPQPGAYDVHIMIQNCNAGLIHIHPVRVYASDASFSNAYLPLIQRR